jgi:tetratricopeptide (TPR) repeat protein
MGERIEEPEVDTEAVAEPISPVAAMAIGMRKERTRAKVDPKLDVFLDEQTRLVRLQTEHLHEQRELVLSRLRWGRLSDRLKVLLQAFTILIGVAVAGAVGAMAWQAHEDRGVTIAAFTVPPDLAARGLTGQVMASKVLDRLTQMQADTNTVRPPGSYANDWAGDIKVEIPETGVSLGELNRALRLWLGRETHITGELVRTTAGLELTARAGAEPGAAFIGEDADLNGLIQKAAESVYAQTQPYRWAVWLQTHGRPQQADAEFARLAQSGSIEDRPWAYVAWASELADQGNPAAARDKARAAIALDPRMPDAYRQLARAEEYQGHLEAALNASRKALALASPRDPSHSRALYTFSNLSRDPLAALEAVGGMNDLRGLAEVGTLQDADRTASQMGILHDVNGALRVIDQAQGGPPGAPPLVRVITDFALDDWPNAVRDSRTYLAMPGPWRLRVLSDLASATARLGRVAEAEAIIAPTPLDCYDCLFRRGVIATSAGDWRAADRWFAEAVRQAPSGADAFDAWGQSLLDRGDPHGAIEKLKQAHDLSPHFADPLEMWGEALMRTGDLQGAAAKFADADKYAPRWGRNHMRWGEALMLSGRYHDARIQYEAANGMDLSRADRAALSVLLARTAEGPLHG